MEYLKIEVEEEGDVRLDMKISPLSAVESLATLMLQDDTFAGIMSAAVDVYYEMSDNSAELN